MPVGVKRAPAAHWTALMISGAGAVWIWVQPLKSSHFSARHAATLVEAIAGKPWVLLCVTGPDAQRAAV